jgi:hypothetical protein
MTYIRYVAGQVTTNHYEYDEQYKACTRNGYIQTLIYDCNCSGKIWNVKTRLKVSEHLASCTSKLWPCMMSTVHKLVKLGAFAPSLETSSYKQK